jgi:hypothetical protein
MLVKANAHDTTIHPAMNRKTKSGSSFMPVKGKILRTSTQFSSLLPGRQTIKKATMRGEDRALKKDAAKHEGKFSSQHMVQFRHISDRE